MSITSFSVPTKPKFKLILLGDQMVGKTCLIEQFVHGKFEDSETPTVGIDFVVTNITHHNRLYRLQLWDTAGQERFKSLIPSYLRDSHCAIILYDVSRGETSESVFKWLELFRDHVEENTATVIVANKIDLKTRSPEYHKMIQKCKHLKIDHIEVSAKTGQNVRELFIGIIDRIEEKLSKPILSQDINSSTRKSQGEIVQNMNEQQYSSSAVKLSPHPTTRRNSLQESQVGNQMGNKKCC